MSAFSDDLDTSFELFKYCRQASWRPIRLSNSQKVNPHGEKVITELKNRCNGTDYTELENFIRMWRKVFLEKMKPGYLPHGWSVEHKMQRTFGENSIFKNNE